MARRLVPLLLIVLAAAGCGGAASSDPAGGDEAPRATTGSSDTNEIRLTRLESLKLVHWATSFRACMVGRGVSLGPLETTPTHIRMSLPDSAEAADVVPDSTACGKRLGGPPHGSSVQYRPGEILLYLPKRCLLDEKVAAQS